MPTEGKYFIVISKLSSLSIGAEGGKDAPGTLVVTCNRNEKDDHQIWYEDVLTGTIRCKANNLCLHVAAPENTLRLQPFESGNEVQQWTLGKNGTIHRRKDKDKVFDICQAKKEAGAQICAWKIHGGLHQLWDFVYLTPRRFYLKSELNGKVLDIEGGSSAAGTKVCMWDQKKGNEAINQLWFEDKQGIIRSAMNEFAIDGSANELCIQPADPNNPKRGWIINGAFICLLSNKDIVLDILQERKESGAHVGSFKQHGKPNQKWKIEYI
jgi:hypothetical protein